jgi:pilus assembly protein Flp/PilA
MMRSMKPHGSVTASVGEIGMSRTALRAGVTAIEYALIAGLIAVVIVAATVLLGENVAQLYQTGATEVGKIPGK